jgi:hypothetical protein
VNWDDMESLKNKPAFKPKVKVDGDLNNVDNELRKTDFMANTLESSLSKSHLHLPEFSLNEELGIKNIRSRKGSTKNLKKSFANSIADLSTHSA